MRHRLSRGRCLRLGRRLRRTGRCGRGRAGLGIPSHPTKKVIVDKDGAYTSEREAGRWARLNNNILVSAKKQGFQRAGKTPDEAHPKMRFTGPLDPGVDYALKDRPVSRS